MDYKRSLSEYKWPNSSDKTSSSFPVPFSSRLQSLYRKYDNSLPLFMCDDSIWAIFYTVANSPTGRISLASHLLKCGVNLMINELILSDSFIEKTSISE